MSEASEGGRGGVSAKRQSDVSRELKFVSPHPARISLRSMLTTLPLQGRVTRGTNPCISHDPSALVRFNCQTAKHHRPCCLKRRRVRLHSISPRKREGGEAPKGAGAERRTPWPVSRSGRSLQRKGSPASDVGRRAFRRFTAAFCRHRAALSSGRCPGSSTSSWQAARSGQPGGAPTPPECKLTRLVRGRRIPLRLRLSPEDAPRWAG